MYCIVCIHLEGANSPNHREYDPQDHISLWGREVKDAGIPAYLRREWCSKLGTDAVQSLRW